MYKLSVYLIPLFFSSCDFPVRKNLDDLLPQNQIRARVLVVDTNSSMVRAEVLACGEFLSKKWGGFSGFEKDFAVQPGALNLLSHTNVFELLPEKHLPLQKGKDSY